MVGTGSYVFSSDFDLREKKNRKGTKAKEEKEKEETLTKGQSKDV